MSTFDVQMNAIMQKVAQYGVDGLSNEEREIYNNNKALFNFEADQPQDLNQVMGFYKSPDAGKTNDKKVTLQFGESPLKNVTKSEIASALGKPENELTSDDIFEYSQQMQFSKTNFNNDAIAEKVAKNILVKQGIDPDTYSDFEGLVSQVKNGMKNPGAKGGIVINIDASTHINITIDVRTAINEVIAELLAAIQNLSAKMDDIINVINGNQENLIYFLQQLFHQYLGTLGSDMGSIRELLTQILNRIEINGGHIGNIEEIMHQLLELELQNQAILLGLRDDAREGFNSLIALIEANNASQEQQTKWLELIYDTINQFKDEQGQYNAQFQQYFQSLMAMVQSGNMTLEQVLAELQAIKNNTAQGNQLLNENNQLLNAIFLKLSSLEAGQGDIRNLILTLIQHCDENTLSIINALPDDMSAAITAMLSAITDLLENIHQSMPSNIPDYSGFLAQILAAIGNIGNNGYDDTQVLQMLQAIYDAILQCCGCGGNGGGSNEGDDEIPELTATNPYAYGNHNPGSEPAGGLRNDEAALMNFLNDLLTNPNGNNDTGTDPVGIEEVINQINPEAAINTVIKAVVAGGKVLNEQLTPMLSGHPDGTYLLRLESLNQMRVCDILGRANETYTIDEQFQELFVQAAKKQKQNEITDFIEKIFGTGVKCNPETDTVQLKGKTLIFTDQFGEVYEKKLNEQQQTDFIRIMNNRSNN